MPKDLSKLSNEELMVAAGLAPPKQDLSKLSNEELMVAAGLAPPKRAPKAPLVSAISGAADAATLGFSDEIIGAIRGGIGTIGGEGKFGDLYKRYRDEQRQHKAESHIDNPKSFLGGEIAGIVATAKLPMISKLIPATGGKIGANLIKGAAAGAISSAGSTEIDPTKSPETLKEFAKEAAIGAGLGAGTQLGFESLSRSMKFIKPANLKKFAEEKAVKAAGAMTGEIEKLKLEGKYHDIGRDLLDKKIVKAFSSVGSVAESVEKNIKSAGPAVGKILNEADDIVNTAIKSIDDNKLYSFANNGAKNEIKGFIKENFQFSYKDAAAAIRKDLIEPNQLKTAAGELIDDPRISTEIGKLRTIADAFDNLAASDLSSENFRKALMGKKIKFNSESIPQAFSKDVYRIINSKIESAVNKIAKIDDFVKDIIDPEAILREKIPSLDPSKRGLLLKDAFQQAKKELGLLKSVQPTARKALSRQSSNLQIGLRESVLAGAGLAGGLASGDDLSSAGGMALGLAAGSKFSKRYGASIMAVTANKLGQLLDRGPQGLGKFYNLIERAANRGTNSIMSTHLMLLKNPEYRAIVSEGNNDQNIPPRLGGQ